MPNFNKVSDAGLWLKVAVLCVAALCCTAFAEDIPISLLDHGYSGLYNLDFSGAQKDFAAWETQHPGNAVAR